MKNETVREAQNGSRTAVDAIVAQYADMASNAAYGGFGAARYEDKRQAAMVGILEAIQTFDAARGADFGTHVYWAIKGAITVECRAYADNMRDMVARDEDGDVATVTEVSADLNMLSPDAEAEARETSAENTVKLQNAIDAIRTLKDRDAEAVTLYLGLDCGRARSFAEVGSIMGLTRERVRQIVGRGLEQIRQAAA